MGIVCTHLAGVDETQLVFHPVLQLEEKFDRLAVVSLRQFGAFRARRGRRVVEADLAVRRRCHFERAKLGNVTSAR